MISGIGHQGALGLCMLQEFVHILLEGSSVVVGVSSCILLFFLVCIDVVCCCLLLLNVFSLVTIDFCCFISFLTFFLPACLPACLPPSLVVSFAQENVFEHQ